MKQRVMDRVVPDRPPYMDVTLARGVHTLKCPSLLAAVDVLSEIEGLTSAVELATGMELSNLGDIVELLRSAGPRALRAMGALIGMAWRHKQIDLETPARPDLMVYGMAVYEELHEAGYTFNDMAAIAAALVAEIWNQAQMEQEVAAGMARFRVA